MSELDELTPNDYQLAHERQLLLKRSLMENQFSLKTSNAIPHRLERSTAPLSYAQQRLWFLHQLEPENANYNLATVLHLKGDLHIPSLEASLNEIVLRHEILRTTFLSVDGNPFQQVNPPQHLALIFDDLSARSPNERMGFVEQFIQAKINQPFDLESEIILRVGLCRIGSDDHLFYMITHHILFDGWSQVVFVNELCELYNTFQTGQPIQMKELPIQYSDYAAWQKGQVESGRLQADLAYWKVVLQGQLPVLDLPTDKPRPPYQTYSGANEFMVLPEPLASDLEKLSRHQKATIFMTLLAGFYVLLARWTNQTDILVGAPMAGRTRLETESLIGMFVNTLVLRADLSGDPSFLELLNHVRRNCLDVFAHQELPFDLLVAELNPERDLSRSPIFQVFFNMQKFGEMTLAAGDLQVRQIERASQYVIFDLSVNIQRTESGFLFTFNYNTDLFLPDTIRRMAAHYRNLLEGAAAKPETQISELPLLSEDERHQILTVWNDTQVLASDGWTIAGLFSEQAVRRPDSPALIYAGKTLAYRDLDQKSNRLARYLVKKGIRPEMIVGLLLDRSFEMVVALLAIIKAGGAFLPLDPGYPAERIVSMFADSGSPLLITNSKHLSKIRGLSTLHVCLDTVADAVSQESAENIVSEISPDHLAYLIYTSGSTGLPKGVLGLHKGLLNRLSWMWQAYPYYLDEVCCQKTSLSMVDSICEILSPLLQGVPIVILADEDVRDINRLVSLLSEQKVSRLTLVPSLLGAMLETCPDLQTHLTHLRICVSSGESLPPELARRFKQALPDCALLNLYGSSEVSADVACHQVSVEDLEAGSIPIGRPISNSQIYILDPFLQLAPIGVLGEIYVGGQNLARGYHQKADLTAECFLPDPFASRPGSRLYETGDLGRYLPDGKIEYLGRNDNQVKLRGYRIELGEIGAALERYPAVQKAAVVLRQDLPTGLGLAAYFTSKMEPPPKAMELHGWLEERLPAYMIPSLFVPLEALPLSPAGKLDLGALPKPQSGERSEADAQVAPRDELERRLVQIWEEVLAVQPIGIRDNFFHLGGHSLLDIRLIALIEDQLGVRLPLLMILKAPTVEQLAEVIRGGEISADWSTLVPLQPGGSKPPLFLVHGLGGGVLDYLPLVEQLDPDQPVYGLMASGLAPDEEPHLNIEDMAARCVRAIKTVQPSGPYYLGGYCFGGVVAYEAACQLHKLGEQVGLLAVMEGFAPRYFHERIQWWDPHSIARFLYNLPFWLWDSLRREDALKRLFSRFTYRLNSRSDRERMEPDVQRALDVYVGNETLVSERYRGLMGVHLQALRHYIPPFYSGRLTLFRVKAFPIFRPNDPLLGWGNLVRGGIDLRIVRGAHYDMHLPPYVESLGARMRECLDARMV